MPQSFIVFRLTLLLILVSNLGTQVVLGSCTEEQNERALVIDQILEEREAPVLAGERILKKRRYHDKIEGVLTVPGAIEIKVKYFYYRQKKLPRGFRAPVLFIYSGIHGISPLEEHLGKYFTKKGISVVVSDYIDYDHIYDLNYYLLAMINTIRANMALTDHFSTLPEVDSNRLGVMGMSYGGIRALYHISIDPRLKAAILMVTGSPIEKVLAKSDLDFVRDLRKKHMEKAGITTIQEYEKKLRDQSPLHITDLTCRRKTGEFYMILSGNDTSVPTAEQWTLWNDLGKPKHDQYYLGHVGVPVWAALFKKSSSHKFLKHHWKW